MGITPAMLRMLAREVRSRGVRGSVLTLGTQDVWGSEADVQRLLAAEELPCGPFTPRLTTSAHFARLASDNPSFAHYTHARSLFEMLGFPDYADLDHSHRDASILSHDLNEPWPAELTSRFDLVLDFGTAEHVFRVDNVLASVAAAAKVGGVVIHSLPLPCAHWTQHGYYCFNPDVLYDFYSVNGFTDLRCRIVYYPQPWGRLVDHRIYFGAAKTFDYRPGLPLHAVVPATAISMIWFSARKQEQKSGVVMPIQREMLDGAATPRALTSSRLRPLLRTAYFAAKPLLGPLLRRAYLRTQGLKIASI